MWFVVAMVALAGGVLEVGVTPAAPPQSEAFAQWTRVGAVVSGGKSPFAADVSVWCKVEAGCEMRSSRGHTAAVSLTAGDTGIRFGPKEGVSYRAFGPGNDRWALVVGLGNKEWNDDWLAPLRAW